jgi:K+-transporting ATPase ATPase C chain
LVHNPQIKRSEIPAELVTASGSGLDPHISTKTALIQVPRIAKSRNLTTEKINLLIDSTKEKPFLGLFGTETVSVLALNLALDNLK